MNTQLINASRIDKSSFEAGDNLIVNNETENNLVANNNKRPNIFTQVSNSINNEEEESDNSKSTKKIKLECNDDIKINETKTSDIVTYTKSDLLNFFEKELIKKQDNYVDHLLELFFLEKQGNLMDYYTWRKKLPTVALLHYFRTFSNDDEEEYENLQLIKARLDFATSGSVKIVPLSQLKLTSEITNVTLPLTQSPLSTSTPQTATTSLSTNNAHISLSSSVTTPSNIPKSNVNNQQSKNVINSFIASSIPKSAHTSPLVQSNKLSSITSNHSAPKQIKQQSLSCVYKIGCQEQIKERAIQEAHVVQRIAELRKEGLWSAKRLPRIQEPPREKAHWDYLLEEMEWLATDFAQERKWKKAAAKKCARMIMKYHTDKEMQAEKTEKENLLRLRKIASTISKEIRQFWSSVEKLVEFKIQTKLEEKRKKALDIHLNYIVDQTEKFSSWLAEGMNKNENQNLLSDSSKKKDIEFEQDKLDNKNLLQCQIYKNDNLSKREDDREFNAESEDDEDDEGTIAAQEKMEDKNENVQELKDLENEALMPVEKLLEKYSGLYEMEDYEESIITEDNDSEIDDTVDEEDSSETEEQSADDVIEEEVGVEFLINPSLENNKNNSEKKIGPSIEITDIAAGAESIQPKGNTLSTAQVKTKVPFLLKGSLREYQHIGLDWLVAMYEKKLNGILADEMGLGKTIQTIALLAHLACEKGIWGPHLIVVPTSVMLNWEMEFKKWCPGFKIITYYGNPKERKLKRQGWTKPNHFHICITSYKLVIQDHNSFRRKKWKYFILDEAQHIKNFKSQRWQMLLNFNTSRRLLLTGTPLQNNLMELWSLMHFLMPNVFSSHRDFKNWFVNPVTGMIEGNQEFNETLIKRLHKVLRPFLLRRVKLDVEKQLPKKYEHVLTCRLSKRQRFLYEEFMNLTKTKETLASGNFLSVINILMQLRKVCNHPNLFETRPIQSPFSMKGIIYDIPSLVITPIDYDPMKNINFDVLNRNLVEMCKYSASDVYRIKKLQTPSNFIEEIDNLNYDVVPVPIVKFNQKKHLILASKTNVSSNLRLRTSQNKIGELKINQQLIKKSNLSFDQFYSFKTNFMIGNSNHLSDHEGMIKNIKKSKLEIRKECERKEKLKFLSKLNSSKCFWAALYTRDLLDITNFQKDPNCYLKTSKEKFNIGQGYFYFLNNQHNLQKNCDYDSYSNNLSNLLKAPEKIAEEMSDILDKFIIVVPTVSSPRVKMFVPHPNPSKRNYEDYFEKKLYYDLLKKTKFLHKIITNMATQFPELRLIQYDCGKLQQLHKLLLELKTNNHRVLIFTQMSRMLDIFEQFLNYHGHTYLRLDGSTKIEQRQALMERFNADKRIFCFILSTRSGGVGVNLTGADTVIFYDSDWNPTMDAQAQDRCHRIGQTRDVHIYRLISEKTIEENILKKAKQKKFLGDIAIEGGNFTTAFFKNDSIKELFNVNSDKIEQKLEPSLIIEEVEDDKYSKLDSQLGQALQTAEEENDIKAAKTATAEAAAEFAEFDESIPLDAEKNEKKSSEEEELERLIYLLTPIEKYAMSFLETIQEPIQAEQLKQAEEEIEAQKKEWELGHLKSLKEEEERSNKLNKNDEILTLPKEEVSQEYKSVLKDEKMPIWAPPTPPQDENDLYIDYSMAFMYDMNIMTESQLPPIYIPKESKKIRLDNIMNRHKQSKIRNYENINIPKSLFDKPAPSIYKLRREIKIQKLRGLISGGPDIYQLQRVLTNFPPNFTLPQPPTLQQQAALSKSPNLILHGTQHESSIYWGVNEDWALIEIIQFIQELPVNLLIISSGHIPNWDFVSVHVNSKTSIYRSPKLCRHHYETVILQREEGRINYEPPKKMKKMHKQMQSQNNQQLTQIANNALTNNQKSQTRPVKTCHLYIQDNNLSFTQLMNSRFDILLNIANKRQPTLKPIFVNQNGGKNHKHLLLLHENNINFDQPLLPMVVAQNRAERIARDKAKNQILEQNIARQKLIQIQQKQQQIVRCQTPIKNTVTVNVSASPQTPQFQQPIQTKIPTINQASLNVSKTPVQHYVASPGMSISANQQVSNLAKALSQAATHFQNNQQNTQILTSPSTTVTNLIQHQTPPRIINANISVNQATLPKLVTQSPVSIATSQTQGGTVLSVTSLPSQQKIIAATITNSNTKFTPAQIQAYKQQLLLRQQPKIQSQLQTQSIQAQTLQPQTSQPTTVVSGTRIQIANNVIQQPVQVTQCSTAAIKPTNSGTIIATSSSLPIVPISSGQQKITDFAQIIQAKNPRTQVTTIQQPQSQQIIASLSTKPVATTTVMSSTGLPVAVPIGSGQHQKIFTRPQLYARKPTDEELDQLFLNRNQQRNQNNVTTATVVQQQPTTISTSQQQSGSISIQGSLAQLQLLHIPTPVNTTVQSQLSREGNSVGTTYYIYTKGNSK